MEGNTKVRNETDAVDAVSSGRGISIDYKRFDNQPIARTYGAFSPTTPVSSMAFLCRLLMPAYGLGHAIHTCTTGIIVTTTTTRLLLFLSYYMVFSVKIADGARAHGGRAARGGERSFHACACDAASPTPPHFAFVQL